MAILAVLALGACTPAPARQVSLQGPTLVSLNPCTDAILAEVADPAQVLALSHYSSDPASSSMDLAKARRFRAVSGSVEEVIALGPDLVVSGNFVSPATREAFARLGVQLEQVPIATDVAQSRDQVMHLAQLVGHPERGRALIARIDAALAAAAPPDSARPTALVWQSGGIVPGEQTLVSDLLSRTGFASFSAARGMKQADVLPLELLLADPPQVILAAGRPQANEDRMLAHPALGALQRTYQTRMDPALLWCGGPTIVRAAQRLAEVRRAMEGQAR